MKKRKWTVGILSVVIALALPWLAGTSDAAKYPTRPVRVILATGAGGSHDMHARAVASVIHQYLGQPFLVQIRGGGGGKIGMGVLKRAKPDGYTIGLGTASHLSIAPHGRDMGFDPLKDFIPFYQINFAPFLLVSRPDKPWKTFDELIAYARRNPGKLTFGSSGAYGASHLMLLAITKAYNLNIKHVPFRGGGKAWQAMWGGHVDIAASTPTTGGATDRIKAGKLRLLAVAHSKRMKQFPDAPTLREKGVDYVYRSWRLFIAPKGTPQDRIDTLVAALDKVMKDKTFKRMIKRFGEKVIPLSGPKLREDYRQEYAFYGRLFKRLGIKKKKKK